MSEFPNTWKNVLLKDISEINSGIGFPKDYQGDSKGDLGFFKVGDISAAVRNHNGRLWNAQHYISFETANFLKGKPIQVGSTVFAKIGEAIRLNRRAFVEKPCLIDNNIMAVKSYLNELDRYIYYYLRTVDFSSQSRATTVPSLRKSDVEELVVPLAPLNEQKRIADKLDRLLAKVDACRERCDHIPLILKRFRQSVLAAATSGELTEDWHVGETAQMQVKSVAETIVNSTQSSTSYEQVYLRDLVQEPLRNGKSVRDGDGPLVLRLSCLKHGRVDWTEVKRGDWGDIDVNRFLVKEGDFLVARGNGSRDLVGRGSLVVKEPPVVAFPDTMIRVRPNKSSILPRYLQIIWDGNEVRAQIELTARTTAGIWKIAQGDLENLLLPVPKIREQQEIVRRVEKLFAFADRLEARYQTARAKCDQLTPALLEKAFQGELVPQDPNDEPASVLLERIKNLRTNAEAKQTKPKRRKTASEKTEHSGTQIQTPQEFQPLQLEIDNRV